MARNKGLPRPEGAASAAASQPADKKRRRPSFAKLFSLSASDLVALYLITSTANVETEDIERIAKEVKAEAIASFRAKLVDAALGGLDGTREKLLALKESQPDAVDSPAQG
jgi:hypothetical protein